MHKSTFISLIVFAVVAVTLGVLLLAPRPNNPVSETSVKLPTAVEAIAPESTSVVSPDGKVTLTQKSLSGTYSFYVGDKFVLSKTTNGKITIPFNTWSIDDKSFFIKESVNSVTNFWIEPMDINLTEKFVKQFPDQILQDVTGWAAQNLLVVNANDGKNDISYWFETDTQGFIRLSQRFN